ncbi:hypothetical protein RDABS01_019132 [Bienertia sinuspersici]
MEWLTNPPFTHPNRQKLQKRIIDEKVKLPPLVTTEAHSLLRGTSNRSSISINGYELWQSLIPPSTKVDLYATLILCYGMAIFLFLNVEHT